MHLSTKILAACPSDDEYDDLAYVLCRTEGGYSLSISRRPGVDEVEVMVSDQITCKTRDLSFRLGNNRATLTIPESVAACLDGHLSYEIEFERARPDVQTLERSLETIFDGVGSYAKDL